LQLSGPPLVALSGPNASDFSVVAVPSTPVGAGQTTTFQVRFRPSATGARLATVSIISNDSDESPYTFTIQGTASPPVANNRVYLPMVFKDFVNAPGLTVESISASSNVQVVSKNIGTVLVVSAFWVVGGAFDDWVARWRRQRTRWG
jgi:hypothetical protein